MNSVERILLTHIDKPGSLFVFPTDVAAFRWADHLLRLRSGGTIAMEQFIAWDDFKQNSIRSKIPGKQSIPSILRKMFVSALIRENALLCAPGGSGKPIFNSLIRPEWAGQADSFVEWLSGLLPQLGIWLAKSLRLPPQRIGEGIRVADELEGDDADLFRFALRYSQFLEQHNLFEPAWETPPFEDTGKECFIFFPESLSDFGEYSDLLAVSGHVTIVKAEQAAGNSEVFFYTDSRGEITEAALYILALHDNQDIPWDSVSVSVPDADNYVPYLLREFENRNIPYIKRIGKPLSSYPAGQFFTALEDCASGDFAFSSLTALLLNSHLPWKDTEAIRELIEFGMKNNCISSWTDEKKINVWEDAFKHPFGGYNAPMRSFFGDLKRQVNAMRRADSFSAIRKYYFTFRERFFNMDNCLKETDLILSRCISELTELDEIEKLYPGVKVPDHYQFFTGYLGEKTYLGQQTGSGVTILPYRTAAPAPFDCHIVLGASQDNLSAVFTPLTFLSAGRREKLGIYETDASAAFINLHRYNSRLPAAFFCSQQTFTGYAIPHSSLDAPMEPRRRWRDFRRRNFRPGSAPEYRKKFITDRYQSESDHYASLHFPAAEQDGGELPVELHRNQKQGFEQWLRRRTHNRKDANNITRDHPLSELIRRKLCVSRQFPGKYSVSPSSLAPYFQCRLKWIFRRILELENVEIETGLMADNITGLVYHAVLNQFLNSLMNSTAVIARPVMKRGGKNSSPGLPVSSRRLLAKNIETVFTAFPALGPGEKPVMSMLTARLLLAEKSLFHSRLETFLTAFTTFFAGYRVIASEKWYSLEKDFYYLNGVVDCILEDSRDDSPEKGALVIVDFKTKYMPKYSDCAGEELADFQLPLYIRLAEAALKKEAHTALFFSIIDTAPQVLFGTIQNALDGSIIPKKEEDRITYGGDAFIRILDETDSKAEQFAREISGGVFSFFSADTDQCLNCEYNGVCRTVYQISRENNNGK